MRISVQNKYLYGIHIIGIDHGNANMDIKYLEAIRKQAVRYTADIFDTLAQYEYDSGTMHLTIVGGGGCLIKNFGVYQPDKVTIIEDICATAKGYEFLAYASMQRKGTV